MADKSRRTLIERLWMRNPAVTTQEIAVLFEQETSEPPPTEHYISSVRRDLVKDGSIALENVEPVAQKRMRTYFAKGKSRRKEYRSQQHIAEEMNRRRDVLFQLLKKHPDYSMPELCRAAKRAGIEVNTNTPKLIAQLRKEMSIPPRVSGVEKSKEIWRANPGWTPERVVRAAGMAVTTAAKQTAAKARTELLEAGEIAFGDCHVDFRVWLRNRFPSKARRYQEMKVTKRLAALALKPPSEEPSATPAAAAAKPASKPTSARQPDEQSAEVPAEAFVSEAEATEPSTPPFTLGELAIVARAVEQIDADDQFAEMDRALKLLATFQVTPAPVNPSAA